ncbi:MAG TPA: ABC transporter substrate-binding protein [Candidatus Dormibacteraeota bacterium]|nr:ABC transporter substrate-binding protein [Candidatus Dormibacteraeota bacterium]
MPDYSISREKFVKGAGMAAAAAAAAFPAFVPRRSEAEETVKIGQVESLVGPFSVFAKTEVQAAAMAVDAWNKRGGVLGRKVEVVVGDDQNNPGTAVLKARSLVYQDKCVALMGTVNSAATLSVSATAASLGVVFVDSGGHTDAVVGEKCSWNSFQTCHNTWMMTHATGYSIAKLFGKRWYLITPDYAFGHTVAKGYEDVIKRIGGQIVGNDLVPMGTADYSSYLLKVEAAKPDCLIAIPGGQDLVNLLKQADSYGLLGKIPVAGPYTELEVVWQLPKSARVGYWGVEWYYKGDIVFGKGNLEAQRFVDEYRKRYGYPPTPYSVGAYVSMDRLLWAINEAKSTDGVKVARTLEGAEFKSVWAGTSSYRKIDHELMWPAFFSKVRPEGTPEDKYDVLEILDRQEASAIAPSERAQAAVCHLGYPG